MNPELSESPDPSAVNPGENTLLSCCIWIDQKWMINGWIGMDEQCFAHVCTQTTKWKHFSDYDSQL